ncbi:hypothetical protein EV194_107135 [Natronoflexus pectinivorans]|uniref:Uncharacterized protein n=1 Tax=Natronoflexus pectinivorans TaxID=682526 RepID=A0A4R2GHV2_9BACT|nr:hypothetical protein EV194_107135 [Natronoflexus pectinivorans]
MGRPGLIKPSGTIYLMLTLVTLDGMTILPGMISGPNVENTLPSVGANLTTSISNSWQTERQFVLI